MRRVGIRQISSSLVEDAATRGEALLVTSDRVLCGVLVPVTQRWVEELVDQHLSRLLHSIEAGEKELDAEGPLSTLDELMSEDDEASGDSPHLRRVGIRDISGQLIEEAAKGGHALLVTSDRVLCGVLMPVTQRWVEELVDQHLSRLLHSIDLGEKELDAGGPLSTLDELTEPAFASSAAYPTR